MRRALRSFLAAVTAGLAGALGAVACTSFDSTPSDTPAEAGLPEGATTDAGQDVAEIGDAGPDATSPGDAARAVVSVAQENARTAYVATDAQYIYWYSTALKAIVRAEKADPGHVDTLVSGPQQVVQALAVDTSGLYWIEVGPDMVQTGSRLMQLTKPISSAFAPTVLFRTTAPISRLALDSNRALTTIAGGIAGATKGGTPINFGAGNDGKSLVSDDMDAFYTFGNTYVYRLTSMGGSFKVITVPSPRELNVEGAFLYGVMGTDAGSAVFKTPKVEADAPATAATQLVQLPGSAFFLTLDNLGVVWGDAADGSIHRVGRLGGAVTDLASAIVGLNSIAADADGVYWASDTGAVGWAPR